MTQETLSTELKYATLANNVANHPTPVSTWNVPTGATIEIEQGHPAVLTVDKNGGGNMPRGARLGLAYREPNDPLDAWTVICDFSIAPFNALSLKDQQSGNNAQRRRLRFNPERVPEGVITLEDADELALVVLSSSAIDKTTLFFNYPMTVNQG